MATTFLFDHPQKNFRIRAIGHFLGLTFYGRGRNMVWGKKCMFFWAKISVSGRKIQCLPYDPNFGQRPVCSPRRDRSFPNFGSHFSTFCFRATAVCVRKPGWRVKKSSPPTVRAPSASNSPSALSVGTKGLHGQFLDNFHLLWHEKISSHSHNFITKLSKLL